MTIRDATQTNVGEYVMTRFFPDVDGDLDGFAARYGTNQRDLVTYAGDHMPGATQNNEADTRGVIGRGDPFPLRIPPDEARFAWGSFENDTGGQLTLGEVINRINNYGWPHEEPHCSAFQLFAYAANADFRSSVLHGRDPSEQRRLEAEPGAVPVAPGATVRFPLVRSPAANNVCVANGCGSTVAPRATWIAAYHAEFHTIEVLANRLGAYREIISELQQHAVMQVARLDFVVEYVERIVRDSGGAAGNPDADGVRAHVTELRRLANEFMVAPGPNAHRPMWVEAHRRTARELAEALRRRRFREWNDRIFLHWQELGLDTQYISNLSAQMAMVVEELGLTDAPEAQALLDGVTTVLQGQTPSEQSQSLLTTFVRNWGPLVQAISGDTPGPASLAGAIMKAHVLRVITQDQPNLFPVVSGGWRERLRALRLNQAQEAALDAAMQDANTLNRFPAMRRVYETALGRTATAFAGALAIYSFYLTWNEESSRRDLLGRATRSFAVLSGLLSSVSGAVSVGQGVANLYELGFRQNLDKFARGLGTRLTRILGVLGFIQGILATIDGYDRHDTAAMMTGVVTALSGFATVAGAMFAIPGLELLGAALGVVSVLIPLLQGLGGSASATSIMLEALSHFANDEVPTRSAGQHGLDTSRFAGGSLYSYVVTAESVPQLAIAYDVARRAITAWGGERLDRTPSNERWLRDNHFEDVLDVLMQNEILRHPDREPLPGGVRTPPGQ